MADLLPAIFGLAGTLVGALISASTLVGLKAYDIGRANSKSKEYLAIRVCSRLRTFAADCLEVSYDQGRPDSQGYYVPAVDAPVFDPEVPDIDWKSLRPTLSYPILEFRDRVAAAARVIAGVDEYSSPPDFSEAYQERQYQYTKLGLRATELADLLHAEAKLPERTPDQLNMKACFEASLLKMDAERAIKKVELAPWHEPVNFAEVKDKKKPDQA